MPLLNGLTAARQNPRARPRRQDRHRDHERGPDLAPRRSGPGLAYLLKRSAASELLSAIQQVAQGRSYVTPLVTQGMLGSLMHRGAATGGTATS